MEEIIDSLYEVKGLISGVIANSFASNPVGKYLDDKIEEVIDYLKSLRMTGFCLYGVIKSFDKSPRERLLLLEYSGTYQPTSMSICPIFVGAGYIISPDNDLEVGDKVCVTGQITNIYIGKKLVPRLIADKISVVV